MHSKLASGNYAIARTKNVLPKNIRLTLYNSLFRSHLEFEILAWGGVSPCRLKNITNLQKKCVRNVAGKQFRSHTDPLFSSLNILKFSDLFDFNCTTFMHKIVLGKQPDSFTDMFTSFSGPNRTKNFHTAKPKNKFLHQFPSFFMPQIWNANSMSIKNIISHDSLKNNVYNAMVQAYNSNVRCREPGCPDCR